MNTAVEQFAGPGGWVKFLESLVGPDGEPLFHILVPPQKRAGQEDVKLRGLRASAVEIIEFTD